MAFRPFVMPGDAESELTEAYRMYAAANLTEAIKVVGCIFVLSIFG